MDPTGSTINKQRLTIRASRQTLSFAVVENNTERSVTYEPYTVRSGISVAANLREAFSTANLLDRALTRADVLVDVPVMLVPLDLFDEEQMGTLYDYAFTNEENRQEVKMFNVLGELNSVAVFAVNKDLKLVIDDHFADSRFICSMTPVWKHLHRRSFTGLRRKMYACFHERRLDIFSFLHNRFKFCNSFDATRAHDALYFLLYVWNQLQLSAELDELHIAGEMPEGEWLTGELRRYLKNVYVINPTADFNRAPATLCKDMAYDMMTFLTRGV